MNPVIILAVLGTIGFVAYKIISQPTKEVEGEKDPLLDKANNLIGGALGLIEGALDVLDNVYDWAQNDLVEYFGGEGYHTLKKHAQAIDAVYKIRRKHRVINGQVIKELFARIFVNTTITNKFPNPIKYSYHRKDNLHQLWFGMVTIFEQAGFGHLFTKTNPQDCGHLSKSKGYTDSKLEHVPTGDDQDFAKAIEAVTKRKAYGRSGKEYYNIKGFQIHEYPWQPNQTSLQNPYTQGRIQQYYEPGHNALDIFTSGWVKAEGQGGYAALHTLVPRHTYLYVLSIWLQNNVAVNSSERRFSEYPLNDRVKIFLFALFGDFDTIYKGFVRAKAVKGTEWKED